MAERREEKISTERQDFRGNRSFQKGQGGSNEQAQKPVNKGEEKRKK